MQFNQAQFAAVVAAAKQKAANSPRWIRAIERASVALQSGELVVSLLHNGALVTSPRGSYFVTNHCECEALKMVEKSESAQSVFANVEYVLFWIMAAELALYGLSAFTLFALAKLMVDDEEQEEFPSELNVRERAASRESRFQNAKSDSERQSLILSQKSPRVSLPEPDRKEALKKLREHLKAVAFYHPNRRFKADLVRGGVTIRLFERQHGHEIAIAQTTQSDKLLAAVNRPDFRQRLVDELIRQEFPFIPAKED